MKLFAALLIVFVAASVNAQTPKFGHIDLQALIQIMPERTVAEGIRDGESAYADAVVCHDRCRVGRGFVGNRAAPAVIGQSGFDRHPDCLRYGEPCTTSGQTPRTRQGSCRFFSAARCAVVWIYRQYRDRALRSDPLGYGLGCGVDDPPARATVQTTAIG